MSFRITGNTSFSFRAKNPLKPHTVFFTICLLALSCTNNTGNGKFKRFKHNFQQDAADDLYNISELLGENPVLDGTKKEFLSFAPSSHQKDRAKGISEIPPLSLEGGYPQILLKKGGVSALLKIRTAKKGEKATISFAQENIYIDPKISFINEYEFLDYKIINRKKTKWHNHLARLLGKLRKFKGFPRTDYYILPLFVGNHLILYKLGPADKIPYDELPLAKRVGNLLAVPLVGYPVEYCVPEVIPDINDRETGQYRTKCEGVQMKYAEYIRLKERAKQVFQYKSKPDLFPRDFFNLKGTESNKDKWFYVRTVVKSPENNIVGHQPFLPSNLVEFHPASGKLDILDAGGYDIKSEDKIRALFIPVEWIDYQIKRDSENLHPDFSEEEKKNIHDRKLRYFKIKFEELVKNEVEYDGEKTLKNVSITDNYFSFNVEITGKHIGAYLVKFAFFKKPAETTAEYIPKQWFEKDSILFFPSFAEKRRYYTKALDYSEADHDRFLRTTRFNPQAKEIKWYFSKQTPDNPENQWVRKLGHLAIELLNSALREAGKDSDHKFKVVLDTNEKKEVGDIRFNILNLIVSEGKSDAGLLGLGPNVANPITGEVVSATANVWVSNLLSQYITVVRQYIRFHVYPPAWKMKPFSRDMTAFLAEKVNKKKPKCGGLPLEPLGVTSFLHEKITDTCPEVSRFIEDQRKKNLTYDPENPDLQDKEVIKSCAKKIAFLPILGVTLHEILHGFAQRHVFSASVDSENFYKSHNEIRKIFGTAVSDTMKELFGNLPFVEGTNCHPQTPQYSSVMDYMDLYNPILFVPGKLDIAALRFIYFDKVDLKNGGVLKVPAGADKDPNHPQKSILKTAGDRGYSKEELKSYKVLCGGDKPENFRYKETDDNQPLCKKFDYGTNPLEIVINGVLKTNIYLMNQRNRYDSKDIDDSSFNHLEFNQQAGDMYVKWKQYRDELLSQTGKSIENYSFLNPEHIRQYQQIIEEEQANSAEFKLYYDVRRPIFDYFKRLVFMPVKHCIYKQEQKNGGYYYSAVAPENIITEVKSDYLKYPENSRERFINCESPVIQTWALENKKGELITEVGFLAESGKYFLRPKNEDPEDEESAFTLWKSIMQESSPVIAHNSPFFDIVMEPEFGNEYYREVRAYILQGTDLNPYIDETTLTDSSFPMNKGQVDFNRILSYKVEEKTLDNLSVFGDRWTILESAINRLKSQTTHRDLELAFDSKPVELTDIGRTAQSIENNNNYPFFAQAYEAYKSGETNLNAPGEHILAGGRGPEISLAGFIKDHPATLYNTIDGLLTFIPYKDAEENFPSQLFRRFNDFSNCIENQKNRGIACEDIEEKESFIKIVLKEYYFNKEEKPTGRESD